jgi:hypothetical protein
VASLPRTKGSMVKKPQTKKIKVTELTCVACGKTQRPIMHYQSYNPFHATGYLPYCKTCLKSMCLNDSGRVEPEKMKEMLKLIDRPYLYEIVKSSFEDNQDTIGVYIKNIAMQQYRSLSWKDSIFEPDVPNINNEKRLSNFDSNFKLTDEIIEFFGAGYSQEEYVAMYRKYNFLKNNYPEKTNMHIEALKSYVRYKVKEELAIADDDASTAEKWAKLANEAAKNAKINPSQLSAADLQDGLSTFGQLVRAVEQSVDIIPILPKFKERPQDKVDFALLCYINYVRDLKGLPHCEYKDIWKFYQDRIKDHEEEFDFLQDKKEMIEDEGDYSE